MKKTVFISLLQTCMIAGLPRSPVEGVQQVPEDEAEQLIEAGMAELADIADGSGDDDGDGLDAMSVKDLRILADTERFEVDSRASKPGLIAAIRDGRARAGFKAELEGLDKPALVERAAADQVEFAEDADEAAIREAVFANRFPPAV